MKKRALIAAALTMIFAAASGCASLQTPALGDMSRVERFLDKPLNFKTLQNAQAAAFQMAARTEATEDTAWTDAFGHYRKAQAALSGEIARPTRPSRLEQQLTPLLRAAYEDTIWSLSAFGGANPKQCAEMVARFDLWLDDIAEENALKSALLEASWRIARHQCAGFHASQNFEPRNRDEAQFDAVEALIGGESIAIAR